MSETEQKGLGTFGENYEYGSWNTLRDSTRPSSDPNRSSQIDKINRALQGVYEKDTLAGVKHWYGVVVRQIDRIGSRPCIKLSHSSTSESPASTTMYNVYIPEVESLPIPVSKNDPILMDYKDVRASLDLASTVGAGAIVKIRYDNPETFSCPAIISVAGSVSADFMPALRSSSRSIASSGTSTAISSGCGNMKWPAGKQGGLKKWKNGKLTYAELAHFREPMKDLMKFISAHEGTYYSVNRGCAGDTRGKWTIHGKNITQMTIKEIQSYSRGGSKKDEVEISSCPPYHGSKRGLFAVGKFQWIPETFKSQIRALGIDRNLIFNKEVQDIMGLNLALNSMPLLGKYIFGMIADPCNGGQHLALVWRSIALQYERCKDGKCCPRGYSASCGGAGGNPTRNIGEKEGRSPDDIIALMHRARQNVLNTPAAVAVLQAKGYVGSGTV